MEEIRTLAGLSRDELYASFNEAFKDYDRTWTRGEFDTMLERRGYTPELSFGAFDNGRLVSFTINSVDGWKGIKTAYDTGTGTIKEYRGKGLASAIFTESIPYLKAAGVQQYLLEVLQHNTKAVSVYSKLGFTVNRGLSYFLNEMQGLELNDKQLPAEYYFAPVTLAAKAEVDAMWDFSPSWQNSFSSVSRLLKGFMMVGVFHNSDMIGYGITDPASGDITQLAVSKENRGRGIGSAILKELLHHNKHTVVKLINAEEGYLPMQSFAENNGIPLRGKQFEMIMNIQ